MEKGITTYKVGIPVEFYYSQRVRHLPKSTCLLPKAQSSQLMRALLVDSFGQKEEDQNRRQSAQCRLQIKNNTPAPVCHNDTSDEWATRKCCQRMKEIIKSTYGIPYRWTDQCARHKPAQGCASLGLSTLF
jgi:hypothetical protein